MSKPKALPPKVQEAMKSYVDAYIASKEALQLMEAAMLEIAREYPLDKFVGTKIQHRDKEWILMDLFKGSNMPARWQSVFVERFGIREVK